MPKQQANIVKMKNGVDKGKIEQAVETILTCVGENPRRAGLVKTPLRVARAFEFFTQGYRQDPRDVINNAIFEEDMDEMVVIKDIELYSLCEHHLLPFVGKVHVAYIPDGKIIGISKVPRLVEVYARRLQVQERLTKEIAETLHICLKPKGVAVVIQANHLCMQMRGVQKQHSQMVTSAVKGVFHQAATRNEFMNFVKGSF